MQIEMKYRGLLAVILAGSLHAASAESKYPPAGMAEETGTFFAALSHTGKWVAFTKHPDTVVLAETASGSTTILQVAGTGLPAAAWASEDRTLAVLRGRTLSLFDPSTNRLIRVISSDVPMSAIEISPDGHYASVIAGHRLQLIDLASGRLSPLTQADESDSFQGEVEPVFAATFKVDRHYAWAPDSRSIACIETTFVNDTHTPTAGAPLPHFTLKLIDVPSGSGRTIVQSDETWSYLLRLAWAPDSKQLAYYRMNRAQNMAEMRRFDGAESRTLVTEEDAYWVSPPSTPQYLADGKSIMVTSERTGVNHVYQYDLANGRLKDLTPEDHNMYRLLPRSTMQERIYAIGTAGDKQNLHLFEIDARGGSFRQLTNGAGWHDAVVDDRGAGFLDEYSSAKSAPVLVWHPASGPTRELLRQSDREPEVQEQFVPFRMHDGTMIPARWFKPASFDAHRRYPVIVYVSSGPDGSTAQNRWGGWPMAWNRSMVNHGYVVLALDPRGTSGYGHLFEEYIHTRVGAQEIVDIREALDQLRQQEFIDSNRIGIWGSGYGGFIAVEALLDIHQGFKAGFADSPIIDWSKYPAYFSERYLGPPKTSAFSYLDSFATRNARRIGGTLMVTRIGPATAADTAQIEAMQAAVDKVTAKRPQLATHFRVLNLGEPGTAETTGKLFEGMTDFFNATL